MTLDEFLRELSARRGLHRKIGMVARYWRQVQKLPADKQQQVALALGSKAAWNRLEKLFAKDGSLSEGELAVKRALDRVGGADPNELRDLASKVRSGNYADVSRELVAIVGDALEEEAESDESVLADDEAVIDDDDRADAEDTADEAAGTLDTGHDAATDDGDELVDVAHTSDAQHHEVAAAAHDGEISRAPREAVQHEETNGQARKAAQHEEAARAHREAVQPRAPAQGVDASATVGAPAVPFPAAEAPPSMRRPAAVLSATEKLAALRRLRTDSGYGTRLGRSGRAELLARLGPGWAARRALSELIRSHAVEHLDEALRLIAGLPSDAQRAWCLGDLVEHWDLEEAELERVTEAAHSPAAIGRLRRRHARRGRSLGADPATSPSPRGRPA